jgi:hypothetical protein
MLRTPSENAERRVEEAGLGTEVEVAVRTELKIMLEAPVFAQSSRCKRFLSYIVEEALSGNAGHLKERTIGIGVFDRPNDYDTGDDSIVRVTANEVRKRLGQFYRESTIDHPIQIELPRGSYVPEFRVQAIRRSNKLAETTSSDSVDGNSEASVAPPKFEPLIPLAPQAIAEPVSVPIESISAAGKSRRQALYLAVVILLVLAVTAFGLLRKRALNGVPDLWGSFLHTNSPVLVCIDTHQLPLPGSASTEPSQKFADMVLRKQIIALDDAAVLASMGAMLGKKDIPFRVVGAEQTSLADLRRQPFILIGAIDNKWTIRLTQNLRYRIEVANPPGSGAQKEPVASIVDSQHPDAPWATDLSVPFNAWKNDYAVIARMDDATTGVPVLIEAGLGNDGTLAANELIASGGLSTDLAKEPSCRGKKNFEAVVQTQIIDTKSGPPHVLHLICW